MFVSDLVKPGIVVENGTSQIPNTPGLGTSRRGRRREISDSGIPEAGAAEQAVRDPMALGRGELLPQRG
jgi:hypothetical protein